MFTTTHDTTYQGTLADWGIEPGSVVYIPTTGPLGRQILKRYMLVKAGANIENRCLVKKDTTSAQVTVIKTAAITDCAVGVNNTGSTITSGNYFLACQGPLFECAIDSAQSTAGAKLMPDASTAGNCDAYAATAGNACIGTVHTTASSGFVVVLGFLGSGL